MRETWYVLEDGSTADPREVAPDAKGVLRHKSGAAVAIGAHGNPLSRGVDADEESGKAKHSRKDMKPEEPKRGYRTRESKSE